jgi:hypothetical protein
VNFPHEPDPEDDYEPGITVRPLYAEDLDDYLAMFPGVEPEPFTPILSAETSAAAQGREGRPGASAYAEYRRRRRLELHAWHARLPGHLLLIAAVFVVSWFLGATFTGPLPD